MAQPVLRQPMLETQLGVPREEMLLLLPAPPRTLLAALSLLRRPQPPLLRGPRPPVEIMHRRPRPAPRALPLAPPPLPPRPPKPPITTKKFKEHDFLLFQATLVPIRDDRLCTTKEGSKMSAVFSSYITILKLYRDNKIGVMEHKAGICLIIALFPFSLVFERIVHHIKYPLIMFTMTCQPLLVHEIQNHTILELAKLWQ